MNYLDGTKEQFMAFMNYPTNQPIQMLNLLKFKEKVEGSELTGAEQYKIYLKAAAPFFAKTNAKIIYNGAGVMNLIGSNEGADWDKVLIVEYKTKQDFASMVTHKDYPSALRIAALEDSRLIFCSPSE